MLRAHRAPLAQAEDCVQLTRPHLAALRLLRERVLENTRLCLDLPPQGIHKQRFVQVPAHRPRAFLGRLISDQNLLSAPRRGHWPVAEVDAALHEGLVQGVAETLEILFELDELDAVAWRLLNGVIDEFYRKLHGLNPEVIRAKVWRDI